jgi:hypothetical protein
MRVYTIHVPRRPWTSITTVVAAAVAVKDGFSWPAFFFSFLWALTQRLWLAAVVLVVVEIVVSVLVDSIDAITGTALTLGLMLVLGWIGNDLKRRGLAKRGLVQQAAVLAESGEDAVRRYFAETAPRGGHVS